MEHKFAPLYDRSKNGKIKIWTIWVTDENGLPEIVVEHGQLEGKKQQVCETIKDGKNIGRANETTPWEQAVSEAKSNWQKQKDKGYVDDLSHATEKKVEMLPMLAHRFDERGKDIMFPGYVQPKLNGVRCLATRIDENTIEYRSRAGKLFVSMTHLDAPLHHFANIGETVDGELFTTALTFQGIISAIKGAKTRSPDADKIQFWIYDLAVPNKTFKERLAMLKKRKFKAPLVMVETIEVADQNDVLAAHERFTLEKFEGTMIRNAHGLYSFKHRSVDLQKLKDFVDEEFEIIGGAQGLGKSIGQCTFLVKTKDGKEFSARCEGADEVRLEQWKNLKKYLGRFLTVRFQNYSDDGVPIFPVGVAVREAFDMDVKPKNKARP